MATPITPDTLRAEAEPMLPRDRLERMPGLRALRAAPARGTVTPFGFHRGGGAAPAGARECTDSEFLDLLMHYRPHGSLMPLEQVRCLTYVSHPGYTLSEHVMRGDILTIGWRRSSWVPVFQFLSPRWAPCPRVMSLMRELKDLMGPVETAYWFCTPCAALGGRTPLQQLAGERHDEVIDLARAVRHYRCG